MQSFLYRGFSGYIPGSGFKPKAKAENQRAFGSSRKRISRYPVYWPVSTGVISTIQSSSGQRRRNFAAFTLPYGSLWRL